MSRSDEQFRACSRGSGDPPVEERGTDEDFANPLRVGPREEVGTRSWSLKVKDPAELPKDPPELPIA